MKILVYCALLVFALSCKKSGTDIEAVHQDTVLDEYKDWYTLKAPVDDRIVGVWGDYNKTILISTMSKIFRTTDQGKNWVKVHEQSIGMPGIVKHQDTLFTMSGLSSQGNGIVSEQILIHADNFSVDDGKTWQRYAGHNPALRDLPQLGSADVRFRINPVSAKTGISWKINQVFLDGPNATMGMFETPGIISSTGMKMDLPQLHQLNSLYLDSQKRIYITGTDAVCETGFSGKKFGYCNSLAGRGVVYVSKNSFD
jgi:hypothetical protein